MPMPSHAHLNLNFNLSPLCREGWLKETLQTLLTTHGFPLDSSTYSQLLQTCIAKNAISQGKQIHSFIIQRGFAFATETKFQNNLINMYVNCGRLVDARNAFDEMTELDVCSWNTIIAAYRRHGYPHEALTLFYQMHRTGVQADQFTFATILSACAKIRALEQGMDIHQTIMERGFLSNVVVASALLDMYAKCGRIHKARELFDKMPQRNVVSWNSMILGYTQNGIFDKALQTFQQMKLIDVIPNSTTFANILPACAKLGDLEQGTDIHQSVMERGLLSDVVVSNALVDMYAKCGSIHKARELFDKIPQKNVVSWTAMIAGYAQSGDLDKALRLFKEMPHRNVVSWTAMIAGYAQNGVLDEALRLFEVMPQKNVVSWNALIAGYAQNGFVVKALETFKQIQSAGVIPDSTTFASILPACAKIGALEQGLNIHQSVIESGFLSYVVVVNALIDMYAKCGSIDKARKLFDETPHRDVISWNAMVSGYAQNGFCKDALKLFETMKHSGAYPDHVSFACVLFACSHGGLLDEGFKYFISMRDSYCISPIIDHYVCMVDLLGRAGYLEETLKFIIKMPIKPVVVLWMSLLGACRSHKNIALGAFTANLLFELDPRNTATYVLLSNSYAEVGRWDEAQMVRRLMKDRDIKKVPGCSWIEGHKTVHTFLVGDRSHPQTKEIYEKLEELSQELKAEGYLPDSRHVANDVEDEEKELFLCHHSEKLAIAFGLLNTSPGTTIRIVKNLRVCVECHTATKFISKIVARQIIVRDANRFHHFQQGQCSCRDYW
ncbi:pentatricopeptide repeat-containing protein At5g48910 [Cryptomeria japonica]|uniref:pentatricopeptide repeat-containing protein At5g48910 n=1 Tax=Cryptomeria japonica TaxID=3369 RepID=UPI0027D9D6EA|nr:pentatricopeptide repeat-containing protein At5g48910 [Cryptomeria japonica]XP_057862800.2 pentatricopeptide repeat-containing protein At5g48910 [Cryptomeria japonica]XP_057862801.2 pentatricopeptide repeat-containing protein At5g48910 [Cryptomeria japonica]